MSYETERLALEWWLDRANRRWQDFQARLPDLPPRWIVALSVASLVLFTVLIRFLHLFESGHYYILSPDSYFFHWVAQGIIAGDAPPTSPWLTDTYWLHSGLAYPLAYSAKAVSSVFNVSSGAALDFVSKLIPPILGVVSMLVMYAAASRLLGRKAGMFSALAWGALEYAYFIGSAGYLDRDGLSALLIMLGALSFYLSRSWKIRIGRRNVGWLVGGVVVLAIEGLLYLEWSFVGSALLLAIVGAYVLLRFLIGYSGRLQTEPSAARRVSVSLSEINPRTVAIIAVGNILALGLLAAVDTDQVTAWFNTGLSLFQSGGTGKALGGTSISELHGLSVGHIAAYRFLLIPMALGLFLAWKRQSEAVIFFASWFACLFVLSLFAMRLLLFAAPAASLLAGAGLAFLWEWQRSGIYHVAKKAAVVLLLALIILPSILAYSLGSGTGSFLAPDRDWQNALAYLREETSQEAVVMTHWNYGYWILDLGQRQPVVDNGYYYFDQARNHDIGVAYTTNDPAEAAEMMAKYGADYLIFSTLDLLNSGAILGEADLGPEFAALAEFPPDSMVSRSLNGKFESGGGLEVVYRSVPDSDVAILQLTNSGPA